MVRNYDESQTRYYIINSNGLYYTGHGEWSQDYSLRYFWYTEPTWMVSPRQSDYSFQDCQIIAETYCQD